MSVSVVRRLRGGLLGTGSLGATVAGMAAIDETFRGQLVNALHGEFPVTLTALNVRMQHLPRVVTDSLSLATNGHMPLAFFAVFGVVLFVLMFKS